MLYFYHKTVKKVSWILNGSIFMVCATEIIMTPFTLIISEFFMLINQISKYIYIYENMISFYTKWESIKKNPAQKKKEHWKVIINQSTLLLKVWFRGKGYQSLHLVCDILQNNLYHFKIKIRIMICIKWDRITFRASQY